MKKALVNGITLTLFNMLAGFTLSYCVQLILMRTNTHFNLNENVILSWEAILFNNSKFLFIYSIPYLGLVTYTLSFVFIYILIGVSLTSMGLNYTMQKLFHLPLEVFALTLPLLIFRCEKLRSHQRMKLAMISYFALFLAAIIESKL